MTAELAPCCADRSNRLPIHTAAPPGWRTQLCGVCGRRHITLTARDAALALVRDPAA